jgi:hypothetical protein
VSDACTNCAHLQAQVDRFQAELAAAMREIERLRRKTERLQRVIRLAWAACQKWLAQTDEVLAQKSGVSRGEWAFARGAHEVAKRLLAILSMGGGDA